MLNKEQTVRENTGEISIGDIFHALLAERKVVVITFFCIVLAGLLYVYSLKPVYLAEAYLLPPTSEGLQELNAAVLAIEMVYAGASNQAYLLPPTSEGLQELNAAVLATEMVYADASNQGKSGEKNKQIKYYDANGVYDYLVQTLKSRSLRREYFNANNLRQAISSDQQADEEWVFEKNFNVKLNVERDLKKAENAGFIALSFEGPDPQLVARVVNEFLVLAMTSMKNALESQVLADIASLQKNIALSIQTKRELALKRKLDRIAVLQEALQIANGLGITIAIDASNYLTVADDTRLYLRGSNALQAEIRMLETRKDDSPFIEDLRDLEEKLAALSRVSMDASTIEVAIVDQLAIAPLAPIKPKKVLIMVVFILTGLMGGVLLGLVRHAFRRN